MLWLSNDITGPLTLSHLIMQLGPNRVIMQLAGGRDRTKIAPTSGAAKRSCDDGRRQDGRPAGGGSRGGQRGIGVGEQGTQGAARTLREEEERLGGGVLGGKFVFLFLGGDHFPISFPIFGRGFNLTALGLPILFCCFIYCMRLI